MDNRIPVVVRMNVVCARCGHTEKDSYDLTCRSPSRSRWSRLPTYFPLAEIPCRATSASFATSFTQRSISPSAAAGASRWLEFGS